MFFKKSTDTLTEDMSHPSASQIACPVCETHFHIYPAQLEAQNGSVRCGLCSHIFNAASLPLKPSALHTLAQKKYRKGCSWLLLLLLLLFLLSGLSAFFRQHLISIVPSATPLLQALCSIFSCKIEAIKDEQALHILHSELVRRDNKYWLHIVLQNQQNFPLALPHLELRYANPKPQPRLVFSPQQYLNAQQKILLTQGINPHSVLIIDIATTMDAAGRYHLLAYYP